MLTELQSVDTPTTFERTFTVLVFLVATGAFLSLRASRGPNLREAEGMIEAQIGWSLVYLTTFVLLVQHCKGFIAKLLRQRLLVLLLSLPLLSTFWSADPALTLRRSVALWGTTLFGLYFGARYDLQDQLKLLSKMCWIAVIGSLICGTLGIGTSVDIVPGWYGIFAQKNSLGGTMALSAVIFLLLAKLSTGPTRLARVGASLSVVLLLLSRSMGALVAFLVVVGVWALSGTLRLTRRRDYFVITGVIVLLILGADWALHHVGDFAAAMQRDVSASGRLYVWVLSVAMALRKPWLGYGYSAFWVGPQGPSAPIWRAMDWATPSAHNGLVQIMLDLGFLGVVVFLVGFLAYSARALRVFRWASAPEMIWPLLFLVFLFLWNMTESAFLSNNSVFWILYVSVVVTISDPRPQYLRKT